MRASWNLLVLLAAFPTACIDLPRPEPLAGGQSEVAEATRLTAVGRVAALRSGPETGPRILYLHGTPGSSGNWLDYLRDPIGGFESFAIDRPGFGRSGDEVRLPLADQVAAAAPYLASGRPNVVVGHSLGAPIAAWLAASYPQHVDGLVLLGSSLDPELECIAWYQVGARGLEPVVPDILNKANDEVWDLDEELRLLQPMLQDIRCPVAIVHGTEDTLVPYANVDYMLEELVNAERVDVWTVEGGDHFVLWRDEDEPFVRQAIESVLPGTEVSEFPVFAADDPALDEPGFFRETIRGKAADDARSYSLLGWFVGDDLHLGAMVRGEFQGWACFDWIGPESGLGAGQLCVPIGPGAVVEEIDLGPFREALPAGTGDFRWVELVAPRDLLPDRSLLRLSFVPTAAVIPPNCADPEVSAVHIPGQDSPGRFFVRYPSEATGR